MSDFAIATVKSVTAAGTTLQLDGQAEASTKRYKQLKTGNTIKIGDRVLVLSISGTYLIIGTIGTP